MSSRRSFIKSTIFLTISTMLLNTKKVLSVEPVSNEANWFMPSEEAPHLRTWMAFGASSKIWGNELLPVVQKNLADIALTIAKYEPVTMLVRQSDLALAKKMMGGKVEFIVCPLDDLWMRDTGPVFVINDVDDRAAINFNFNGWGEKQDFDDDANVASFVAHYAKALEINTNLILEGGGVEVDGDGTAIITESCVLNENRNPRLSKVECEIELKRLLGLEKIIWLPGVKGKDITDGHTDFYARFARPGVVVTGYDPDPESFDHKVTAQNLNILRKATDAKGRSLDVVVIKSPATIREKYANDDFAAGYINFYICNGAVILPEFGDVESDSAANNTLQKLFPQHDIIQLNIDGIAAGGGGIHCTTQQEPKA